MELLSIEEMSHSAAEYISLLNMALDIYLEKFPEADQESVLESASHTLYAYYKSSLPYGNSSSETESRIGDKKSGNNIKLLFAHLNANLDKFLPDEIRTRTNLEELKGLYGFITEDHFKIPTKVFDEICRELYIEPRPFRRLLKQTGLLEISNPRCCSKKMKIGNRMCVTTIMLKRQ